MKQVKRDIRSLVRVELSSVKWGWYMKWGDGVKVRKDWAGAKLCTEGAPVTSAGTGLNPLCSSNTSVKLRVNQPCTGLFHHPLLPSFFKQTNKTHSQTISFNGRAQFAFQNRMGRAEFQLA